jgi:pyridoxamine 5'-phosphate oxidase
MRRVGTAHLTYGAILRRDRQQQRFPQHQTTLPRWAVPTLPVTEFLAMLELTAWRSALTAAIHRNRSLPNSRYAQLATIGSDGKPANRTIVFRGFVDDVMPDRSNDLKFVTDRRSEKVGQIAQNAWGELCWYFPKTREQFRVLGELSIVDFTAPNPAAQKLRRMTWHNLSDSARSSFAWPEPKHDRADASAFAPQELDPHQPIDDFCLMLLSPTAVDHLQLKGEPQNRCSHQRIQGQWEQRSVNP